MKILIIEDEAAIAKSIKNYFKANDVHCEEANNFKDALAKIDMYDYDCILLDLMLPDGDGFDLLRHLKKNNKTEGVIIISAKDSLDDKLKGLELGADDYLTKPFHNAELNARIKAVLRRKNLDGKDSIIISNLEMDLTERRLTVNGENLALNRKEFDILNYFLLNKNRLVTKTALAEHVWGDNIDQADNFDFIYYQIKNLRKKLQQSDAEIEIEAIYGIGYKLKEK